MTKDTRIVVSILLVTAFLNLGCAPRVTVRKNPCDQDCGFRYYRPKPYLLISPAAEEKTIVTKGTTTTTATQGLADGFVSIDLQYLPDFSEEYAVDIRNGLGTSNVTLTLEDGWNLTHVGQELDAKFDENVGAVAELIKAGGSVAASGLKSSDGSASGDIAATTKRWVVRATNIPLGYYESVIGRLPNGNKQMFGWRYVGFAPFNSCPTNIRGVTSTCCDDEICGPVYGLAFVEGVMVFRNLGDLQRLPDTDEYHFQKTTVPVGTIDPEPQEAKKKVRKAVEAERISLTVSS